MYEFIYALREFIQQKRRIPLFKICPVIFGYEYGNRFEKKDRLKPAFQTCPFTIGKSFSHVVFLQLFMQILDEVDERKLERQMHFYNFPKYYNCLTISSGWLG